MLSAITEAELRTGAAKSDSPVENIALLEASEAADGARIHFGRRDCIRACPGQARARAERPPDRSTRLIAGAGRRRRLTLVRKRTRIPAHCGAAGGKLVS